MIRLRRSTLLLLLLASGLSPTLVRAQDEPLFPRPTVPIAFNRLHDTEELAGLLQKLVAAHPDLLALRSIGKSVEGRDLWCVTVNNARTGEESAKPALYVDANIHGNEIQGGEVCLYVLWYLTEQYGRNPRIRELVDTHVFYVVPTVNPDGRAHWFRDPNTTSSSRSGVSPYDDDRDGVADEDGYDDIDGDGQVAEMRRRSPTGEFKLAPGDPRSMIRIEPGEDWKGERYERLGEEGLDNDGDGAVNEDPPGGYDMNRNYPADWQPTHLQYGAGPFPLCWPETRSVASFLFDHPNVGGVLAFHNAAGMILRGPGSETRRDQHPPGDERALEAIGANGARLLPFYRNLVTYKDLYSVHGGFTDWTYEHLGVFSYVVELWNNEQLLGQPASTGSTLERAVGAVDRDGQLFASDRLLQGSSHVDWRPFQHPLHGAIEVGGFVKQSQRVPPPFLIEEMCHRNAAFVLYMADQLPRVEWDEVSTEPLGNGIFAVNVAVRNTRLIPTVSDQSAQRRLGLPDRVEIAGQGLNVVAGGLVPDRDTRRFEPVAHRPEVLNLERGVRGRSASAVRWIIRGSDRITVRFVSQKGGVLTRTLELR